jgi:hypothetical protein
MLNQRHQKFIQVVTGRTDAEHMLELAGGNDDARRSDEPGNDRVRQEVGEKAQPQHTHGQQEHAGQEGQRDRGGYVVGRTNLRDAPDRCGGH